MKKILSFLSFFLIVLVLNPNKTLASDYYLNNGGSIDDPYSWYDSADFNGTSGTLPSTNDQGYINSTGYANGNITASFNLIVAGGTLYVSSASNLEISGGGALYIDSGGSVVVDNSSALNINGAVFTISNSSHVNVTGTSQLNITTSSSASMLSTSDLFVENGSTFYINGSTFLTESGQVNILTGSSFSVVNGGTVNSQAPLTIDGSYFSLNASTLNHYNGAAAYIQNSSTVDLNNSSAINIYGTGTSFNVTSSATVSLYSSTLSATDSGALNYNTSTLNSDSGSLINVGGSSGAANIDSSNFYIAGGLDVYGGGIFQLDNSTTLELSAGSTFALRGTSNFYVKNYSGLSILSQGTVTMSDSVLGAYSNGIIGVYATTLNLNNMNLDVDDNASGSGSSMAIASDAVLNLNCNSTFDLYGTFINDATYNYASAYSGSGVFNDYGMSNDISGTCTAPVVVNVTSSKANGAYKYVGIASHIPIQVVFDQAVEVTGSLTLRLETGTTDTSVSYSSGASSGNTLVFNYFVATGNTSSDLDYTSTSALTLGFGSTIRGVSNTVSATLTLPSPGAAGSLGANKNIVIDTTVPSISAVATSTTATTATISWSTNEAATSTVNFGTTSGYGTASSSPVSIQNHSFTLTGLTSNTTYHYRISSWDVASNLATTTDTTFTTAQDLSTPTITVQSATSITTSSTILNGTVTSDGNASSTSHGFNYGTTISYGSTLTTTASFGTGAFSNTATGLTCNTTYHYRAYAINSQGTGTSSDATFTTSACPDTTPPVISSIATSTTQTTATISWDTDEVATSTVNYGVTSGYGTASSSPTSTQNHSFTLEGLTPNTTYHFSLSSWDAVSNLATTTDATFTTSAAPDTTPPVISSIATSTTQTTATISWDTDEVATSTVNYGVTSGYGTASSSPTSTQNHSFTLEGLTPNTTYHFSLSSWDAASNLTTTVDDTFTTLDTVDTTAPSAPSSFTANVSNTSVALSWTNPTDLDFDTVTIRRSTSSYPTSITDGTGVVSNTTSSSYTDTGLSNGTYYYSIFAKDTTGNVSVSADISAVVSVTTSNNSGGSSGGSRISVTKTTPIAPSTPTSNPNMNINTVRLFTTPLSLGKKNSTETLSLQKFLNDKGYTVSLTGPGSKGKETNYFGPATRNALAKFQKDAGITPAIGIFGPKTMEYINKILTVTNNTTPTVQPIITPTNTNTTPQVTSCNVVPNTYIKLGQKNVKGDVILLEAFLNVYEKAGLKVNGIYEKVDYSAVVKFQEKYASSILTPSGLTKGTGYVYTSTIQQMKEVGCR